MLSVYNTDAYAKVICDVIEELKPEAFLIGATNIGRDLAGQVPALGNQLEVGGHQLALALLAEDPNVLEGSDIRAIRPPMAMRT